MKDITKEIKKMIEKLEQLAEENSHTLEADGEVTDKMIFILNNIMTK
ncbi:hypothetical protein ACR77J_07860 [Tissierella praeacuta]